MSQETTYLGIDVAKDQVDGAVRPGGRSWSVQYDEAGVDGLVARLNRLKPAAVITESTGGLELALVAALAAASLPVAVVNPRQVRDFAKSTGQLAKTDRLDAQVLAHFGEALRPAIRPLRDADTRELGAMLARRRQVIDILVAEKNRLSRATAQVRPRIESHISWLQQELDDLDTDLRNRIHRSPLWRETAGLTGEAQRMGRSSHGAICTVHGSAGGESPQPCPARVLPASAGSRQTEEGSSHCVHEKVADHPEQHGEDWSAMGCDHPQTLTGKTVA